MTSIHPRGMEDLENISIELLRLRGAAHSNFGADCNITDANLTRMHQEPGDELMEHKVLRQLYLAE